MRWARAVIRRCAAMRASVITVLVWSVNPALSCRVCTESTTLAADPRGPKYRDVSSRRTVASGWPMSLRTSRMRCRACCRRCRDVASHSADCAGGATPYFHVTQCVWIMSELRLRDIASGQVRARQEIEAHRARRHAALLLPAACGSPCSGRRCLVVCNDITRACSRVSSWS